MVQKVVMGLFRAGCLTICFWRMRQLEHFGATWVLAGPECEMEGESASSMIMLWIMLRVVVRATLHMCTGRKTGRQASDTN